MGRAFTRAVSPLLAKCELTHLDPVPIDAARASAQHDGYERALGEAGLEVVRLPELAASPDAVFVEDTALLLGDHAIILRPGAPSRASETQSTARALATQFEVHHLPGGSVDGGDVLRIGTTLHVGRSTRTSTEGIKRLREVVAPLGYTVVAAALRDCLHLKTGATLAGPDADAIPVLLYAAQCVDPAQFSEVEAVAVADEEAAAANCLRLGGRLLVPAGNPRTADRLRARGFDVIEIDIGELQKAEAGLTCMSLVDDRT